MREVAATVAECGCGKEMLREDTVQGGSAARVGRTPRGVKEAKFSLGCIAASLLLLLPLAARADLSANAPVDVSFGRTYKMTVLGIRNHAICLAYRIERNADDPQSELAHGELMEGAIGDWEQRYPRDADLPRDIFLLEVAYGKARSADGLQRMNLMHAWLQTRYPESREARVTITAARAADPGECHMTRDAFETEASRL
jgi:hypothetical protein